MRIYDNNNVEQDWDWLVSVYGDQVRVQVAEAGPGEPVMRVVELRDKVGYATQVVRIVDADGNALTSLPVLRYWPGAPELPNWTPPPERWFDRGVIGYTNENGDVGFGMGGGDFYFPGEGSGASAVWIGEPSTHTDCVSGLGMIGLTDHEHLDVVFQLTVGEGDQPSSSPSPSEGPPPDEFENLVLYYLEKITTYLERGTRTIPA